MILAFFIQLSIRNVTRLTLLQIEGEAKIRPDSLSVSFPASVRALLVSNPSCQIPFRNPLEKT